MALNLHVKETLRNSMLDELNGAIGASGLLRVYSGTQPATADTALAGNTLLAELTLSATAFGAAAAGVATLAAVGADISADATGTATWATLTTSAGVRVIDGSCGASGTFDFVINSAAIQSGARVELISYTFSIAA